MSDSGAWHGGLPLETVLQQAPVGILIAAAPHGELVFANDECERLFGSPLELGAALQEWRPQRAFRRDGSPLPTADWPVSRALNEGAIVRGEEMVLEHGDGTRVPISVHAGPICDALGTRSVFASFCDAGELGALRSRNLSGDDLTHFLFSMAHDLQEPLRMIGRYTTLLENQLGDALGADGRAYLDYVAGGVRRMRRLITDLMIWSQVSASGPHVSEVDMNSVFNWVMGNLRAAIDESGARISCSSLPRVRGDFARLTQLLQNLIANAIRYSGDTRPLIEISAEAQAGHVLFSVRDHGIGIAPEFHETIFGMFRRLHGDELPGTGIGLAVSRRIVERHGGRLWVESKPGEGATFYFTLPYPS